MTLKEQYWKDGNIFRMSTNEYKMVWGDKLIDNCGDCYISSSYVSDYLYNTASSLNEHVIEVYAPNTDACCFSELIRPTTSPIWKAYDLVITRSEILQRLGLNGLDQRVFILDE